jgi:dCTP diphosphatase
MRGRSAAGGLGRRDLCSMRGMGVQELIERIRAFNREREWGQYHSPKNLVMALAGEVGELIEHFQWLTEEQSRHLPAAKKAAVEEEIGDVTICLLNLADQLGVDILDAAGRKLERNKAKTSAGPTSTPTWVQENRNERETRYHRSPGRRLADLPTLPERATLHLGQVQRYGLHRA